MSRKQFPVLTGGGATVDFQMVADHGGQARKNHYQSVERLAERGGLSWGELNAVLQNKPWQQEDTNAAMIACRSLEAEYLAPWNNIATLTTRAEAAEAALERDRTFVAETINAVSSEISGREWLLTGRGPYEWDDDRYRAEFADAIAAIRGPIDKLRAIARDWTNCPTDPDKIKSARAELEPKP